MARIFRLWRNLNSLVEVGVICLLTIIFLGTVIPNIIPTSPTEQNYSMMYEHPNPSMLFGGDKFGRDVFVRVLVGIRYSLSVGLISSLSAGVIGTFIGIISAYYGKLLDLLVQRLVDAIMSIPIFMLGLLVVVAMGTGFFNLLLAITIALTPRFARLARGQTLEVLDYDYIEAAEALGAKDRDTITKHILPNIIGPIIVQVALFTGTAIIIESGISFLGLGIQPPTPSFGTMIKQGLSVLSLAPWVTLGPASFLVLTVLSVNILGDGLRNQFDPKASKKKAMAQTTER